MVAAHSEHARRRCHQGGIPPLLVQWLWEFGRERHDGAGAVVLHFDRKARRALERSVGREVVRQMRKWMDAYLVVSTDGTLITAGHRYARLRH